MALPLGSGSEQPPPRPPPRKPYFNYKKANWPGFTEATELAFAAAPPPASCSQGEATFRRILTTAAKLHIPCGHIKDHIPNLPDAARPLIREREALRRDRPRDPSIARLDHEINAIIATTARKTWIDKVESCSPHESPGAFWSLLRSLSGSKARPPPNQPVSFGDRTLTRHSDIAKAFCKQFTAAPPRPRNKDPRRLKRRIRARHPLNTNWSPISAAATSQAIRDSGNSTAMGPDGLNILHLKHLGPTGITYLTSLYNLSLNNADVPSIWKKAIIIPIHKPAKPIDQGPSYRPISLLSPAAKVLERLILPSLSDSLPPVPSQHGFRSHHSTTTALLPLTTRIAVGFNQRKPHHRSLLEAVDYTSAFDTVPHINLLTMIEGSPLHPNLIRWLNSYLSGRFAVCQYGTATSPCHTILAGVPQGSVISPALFNFYVSDFPHNNAQVTSYADDFTAATSHEKSDTAAISLSAHATSAAEWADSKGLRVSLNKSSVTLFTNWTSEYHKHPVVSLGDRPLPLDKKPKVLGVTLDPHFTFSPHIKNIARRAAPRINILKALAGSTWGQDRDTLLLTFGALIKPIITYACPAWFPNISKTNITRLQTLQNSALRIATGCHKMTKEDHLHQECQVLPVFDSLSLLCRQFLLSALRTDHPSHGVVTAPSGPRPIKKTLQSAYVDDISHLLTDDICPEEDYRPGIKTLHTEAVSTAIRSLKNNEVLNAPPPPLHEDCFKLPRPQTSVLSQLRSGYCRFLNSYRQRIGLAASSDCPDCPGTSHTTQHLFSCPAHPTDLTVRDLWEAPRRVIAFLASLPAFADLPLPRPPPEPPPGNAG